MRRLLLVVLAAGSIPAQQPPRFVSSTSAVRLPVTVLDRHGVVRGVPERDFTVTDGGTPQNVHVEEIADVPLRNGN